jgi:hypothetical protein
LLFQHEIGVLKCEKKKKYIKSDGSSMRNLKHDFNPSEVIRLLKEQGVLV